MKSKKKIIKKRIKRAVKVRSSIKQGGWPRLSVFKSNKYIYAQIINDESGKTLAFASSSLVKKDKKNKTEEAKKVGITIGNKAKEAGIKKVVFDRGRYAYHGRVKSLAEGAREAGLEF
ncbi:MAG: 50S ribosomal protein L18 [Candidatus Pacebacteria bacterium]|nr:50S ribosomal protein L18 [Candidatus Paceibacterota bacterium]